MSDLKEIEYKENKELRISALLVGGFLALILTLLFRMEGYAYNFSTESFEKVVGALDLSITSTFYEDGEWLYGQGDFWQFLNDNDVSLMGALGLIVLAMITVGIVGRADPKRRIWLRYGWFVLFNTVVIAGLVVNVIFKGMWGRWRPRHTVFFGGDQPFYAVWDPAWAIQPESIGSGVSFPSGHPTAIASYLAIFFIFNHPELMAHLLGEFKEWKVKLCLFIKWFSFVMASLGAILMGVARIVVGAHFASDVLWTLIFTFALTPFIYYILFQGSKVEKDLVEQLNNAMKKD